MSRAFVKEDADGAEPRYTLPDPGSPEYPLAAARALLIGANRGDTTSAENATGHAWGDPRLVAQVTQLRAEAIERDDDRMITLAERYLRTAETPGQDGESTRR